MAGMKLHVSETRNIILTLCEPVPQSAFTSCGTVTR
jgi:hypothetical protein